MARKPVTVERISGETIITTGLTERREVTAERTYGVIFAFTEQTERRATWEQICLETNVDMEPMDETKVITERISRAMTASTEQMARRKGIRVKVGSKYTFPA